MPATTYAGPALTRLAPGHYKVEGLPYRVFRYEGKTSVSGRSRPFTEWQMLRETEEGFEKDMWGHHKVIVKAGTIESLKVKLERYFTPRVLPEV